MADTAVEPRDLAPDLFGVKSRVCWGAILAGAVIALACSLVLTLLLAAIGMSLTVADVRAGAVATGIIVAVMLAAVVSLFLGGWVSSQLTVGENRGEAAMYGLLTWGAVTAMSLALVGMGMKAGYFAVVGGSIMVQNNERIPTWEESAQAAGVSAQQVNELKAKLTPANARAEAADPANQEKAQKAAMYTAWMALVGTMLSMAAAVGGAVAGRGVHFRLFPVAAVRTGNGPRLIVPTA